MLRRGYLCVSFLFQDSYARTSSQRSVSSKSWSPNSSTSCQDNFSRKCSISIYIAFVDSLQRPNYSRSCVEPNIRIWRIRTCFKSTHITTTANLNKRIRAINKNFFMISTICLWTFSREAFNVTLAYRYRSLEILSYQLMNAVSEISFDSKLSNTILLW